MLNEQTIYVPCVRSGASELNALLALENERKELISPLLFLTGNDWNKIERFIMSYSYPLWLDSSQFKLDEEGTVNNQLNNPENNYEFKINKFTSLLEINRNISPIVSIRGNENARNTISKIKIFLEKFKNVGIRIELKENNFNDTINLLDKILLPFDQDVIDRFVLFLDIGKISSPNIYEKDHLTEFLSFIENNLTPKNIITVSTAYPAKPVGILHQECHDIIWQEVVKCNHTKHNFIYGDYAATSPTDIIQVSDFMRPRPASTYLLDNLTWYIESQGKVQEYVKFIQIAQNIRALDGYHGDDFCWSNNEIKRISEITDPTQKGYGGQQQWNEYKIHQHICAILESKNTQPEEIEEVNP